LARAVEELYDIFSVSLKQIDKASLRLAEAMAQSSATTSSNAHHIEQQQQQVIQVATASEEMSATSAQISQNILQVAEAARNVREKSENGESHVKDSVAQ